MIIALVLLAAMAVGFGGSPLATVGCGEKVLLSVFSIPAALLAGMFSVKLSKFIGAVIALIMMIYLANRLVVLAIICLWLWMMFPRIMKSRLP